jgi:para-aminobenzoate synthetase component I
MAKRRFVSFTFSDLYTIKQQVLDWLTKFDTCCFLDSQEYPSPLQGYGCIAAAGEKARVQASAGNAFEQLRKFSIEHNDWLFGHFSFDLKTETEQSPSHLPDFIQFPDLFFFVPDIILIIDAREIQIGTCGDNHQEIFDGIVNGVFNRKKNTNRQAIIQKRISRELYLETVNRIQEHILRGDCYEINFCQEFFVEGMNFDPYELYKDLHEISPSPFSAFYRIADKFLLCASPERYLKKEGLKILSQPIKGTSARDTANIHHDNELRVELASSEKDRAENVMVVDLVRNDLSKVCETDSVRVTELFGIYSFAQVHQMISTIEGIPLGKLHWTEMIAGTFPMGSMTGAPKRRVLELIEQYEKTKRGIFSGAVGYVKPNQDFDFNVVIRSLLYNNSAQYLSYFAGSGITANSDPEKEYEECLVKVTAFERVIKNPSR